MSESNNMLTDSVNRLFQDLAGQPDPWPLVEEFGLPRLMLPDSDDGFNGTWQEAGIVFQLLGQHAVPLPIGETILACSYLYEADEQLDRQLLSGITGIGYCPRATVDTDNRTFRGTLADPVSTPLNGVPARILVEAVTEAGPRLILLDAADTNDGFVFSGAGILFSAPLASSLPSLLHAGALLRTAQISGAIMEALRLSIQYVNERSQFGRPLAKFQAIQHDLARLAEQAAAVQCATQAACQAADFDDASFEIGAAKLRANIAIPHACAISHQVHGAIGYTAEHSLHRFTRRLTAWRGEFGNDRFWANALGKIALKNRDSGIWQLLTARGDSIMETTR